MCWRRRWPLAAGRRAGLVGSVERAWGERRLGALAGVPVHALRPELTPRGGGVVRPADDAEIVDRLAAPARRARSPSPSTYSPLRSSGRSGSATAVAAPGRSTVVACAVRPTGSSSITSSPGRAGAARRSTISGSSATPTTRWRRGGPLGRGAWSGTPDSAPRRRSPLASSTEPTSPARRQLTPPAHARSPLPATAPNL